MDMNMNYYLPIPPVHGIDLREIDLTPPNDDGLAQVDYAAKETQIAALENVVSDAATVTAQKHAPDSRIESIGVHIIRSDRDQEPFVTSVFVASPQGDPVYFGQCSPGFFIAPSGELCLKTEYRNFDGTFEGMSDAYCSSGECFWGGTINKADRDMLIVQPVEIQRIVGVRTP
jgi:hypothetical protein